MTAAEVEERGIIPLRIPFAGGAAMAKVSESPSGSDPVRVIEMVVFSFAATLWESATGGEAGGDVVEVVLDVVVELVDVVEEVEEVEVVVVVDDVLVVDVVDVVEVVEVVVLVVEVVVEVVVVKSVKVTKRERASRFVCPDWPPVWP